MCPDDGKKFVRHPSDDGTGTSLGSVPEGLYQPAEFTMPETISEERLRELESQCGDGSFDDGYGGGEGLSLSELRALIAGYREREKWKDLYSMVKAHCQAAEAEVRALQLQSNIGVVNYGRAAARLVRERDALQERLERVRARASSLRATDKDGHFGDGLSAAGAQVLAIIEGKDEPLAEREG